MANKDTSKQWFETGDFPTQTQFAQTFDWLRWKDEVLAITDVTGLQDVLNTIVTLAQILSKYVSVLTFDTDGQHDMVPGEIITGMIFDAPLTFSNSIGSTLGGNDIYDSLSPEIPGTPEPLNVMIYAKAARSIYFSGITQHTTIILLKNSTV